MMPDSEHVTLATQLDDVDASRSVAKAVSARHAIARKYVMRLRRRHPEATPAELVQMLERHYGTSITTAGALITASVIAADIGIGLIPVAGAAAAGVKSAGQQAAKRATKETLKATARATAKAAARSVALGAAKSGAQRIAGFLPAGDEQLQFEITAVFALAVADIHGQELDRDQAHALVYGLTNERVSQEQIATMASDVAEQSPDSVVSVGRNIAAGRGDWSHWATTLADTLPGEAAQSFVRTIQTGQLDDVRAGLSGKQQATIEYGVGAVAGGVARFVFGREVIASARIAFPPPPEEFPPHLAVPEKDLPEADVDEPNRALAALEDAAKTSGTWIADTAGSVGTGMASAADSVTRPFRRVDIDGDGVPDDPRAMTAAKDIGGAVADAAGSVGGTVANLFRSRKRDRGADQADSE